MRIAIVTDAWAPQVNGVVRTLRAVIGGVEALGHEVLTIAPDQFRNVACPGYSEIRLALAGRRTVGARIAAFGADAIHIATEGPLGLAARRWCVARGHRFTTAYHTQFPAYLSRRTGIDADWFWRYIRWFHAPADAILSATPSIDRELAARGLTRTMRWGRGVDVSQFAPDGPVDEALFALPRPMLLYVGRVAVEKNIAAFLSARHPGTKVVVGDGPARAALAAKFPAAHFTGALHGAALAAAYRAADVLVFPSRTDTFGLVMIEAIASGVPVAAYRVTGPCDVLTAQTGAMAEDIDVAITRALMLDRQACARGAARFDWGTSTRQFLAALAPLEGGRERVAA